MTAPRAFSAHALHSPHSVEMPSARLLDLRDHAHDHASSECFVYYIFT